ncbi:double-strand break repair protein AddB [Oryzibacter oryziterrae]|uniref:double-strand break repair protein AddB n=1 Tax=Oryzibacter oryziterrae TaxID=2766474 RepID=UPI001F028CCC|nr:double-strand break repair protein AddB [Oryzibacter oryziterrae]
MGRAVNVLTIHPAAPFLPTLAEALLDGRLFPGRRYRDDPLALADVTIFLPTQRAVAGLSAALREAFGGGAVILPRLRAIADAGEALGSGGLLEPLALDLPPVMSDADRKLLLVQLVRRWRELVATDRHLTPSGQALKVPNSTADAFRLADDLLALMDQAALEGVDWGRLATLVPDDYAAWWQMSLTFLDIATQTLPALMAERGRIGQGDFQAAMIDAAIAAMAKGTRGPVAVAGSTGSVDATARLMAAVLSLPEGAVVLPGLDLSSDDALFARFSMDPPHCQHTMSRLLARLGVDRREVTELTAPPDPMARRIDTLFKALVPADATHLWPDYLHALDADPGATDAAFAGVRLALAANEAEEALAAAIALRETLEQPDTRVMLVTPDRTTARRVIAELARFGIEAADTAGMPLSQSAYGALALLIAEIVEEGYPPVKLASLLAHPETRFGLEAGRVRAAGRLIELRLLRGPRLGRGGTALQEAAGRLEAGDGVEDAQILIRRLVEALQPLEALVQSGTAPLSQFIAAERAALEVLTAAPQGEERRVGRAEDGFKRLCERYLASPDADLPLPGRDWSATLKAMIGDELVRTPSRHSRVTITGPLEARLLRVDRLVLAGLNEGTWPQAIDTGPWLSRPMRTGLGMQAPEVRIGLSAHDFVEALGTPDVVIVRSTRKDGAPTVPSRFLQRLIGLIGTDRADRLVAAGACYVAWARAIDDRPRAALAERPNPTPPVAARPRQLSVTEIETLIRDPYAVYARRILQLKPLDDLGELPDFGTRGTLLHGILAEFASTWSGAHDGRAVAALIEIGRSHFARLLGDYPEMHAQWWPRFEAIADYFVTCFEAVRAPLARHPEIKGQLTFAAPAGEFTLTGRADRIDVETDGRVSIIDFKTGAAPTAAQIAAQLTPQLPLEAVIAGHGGFGMLGPRETAELIHVVLSGIGGRDETRVYTGHEDKKGTRSATLAETIAEAESRLTSLIAAYDDPARGYLSRARPFKQAVSGDYDHLARVQEWQIAADEGDGEA